MAANLQRQPQLTRMTSAPPYIAKPTFSTINPLSSTNFGTLRFDDSRIPQSFINVQEYTGRLMNGAPLMRTTSNPLIDLRRQQTEVRNLQSSRA